MPEVHIKLQQNMQTFDQITELRLGIKTEGGGGREYNYCDAKDNNDDVVLLLLLLLLRHVNNNLIFRYL